MLTLLRKNIAPYVLSLMLAAFVSAQGIGAQVQDSVTATVTPSNVALSVAPGTVAYGTISLSSTADTTSTGLNNSQTITNDGNVNQDFTISGQNTAAWTLSGTSGANTYIHQFCTSNCDGTPTWVDLVTGNTSIATGVAAAGTQVFDLKITMPSETSSYLQQSVDVTVTATAS